MPREKSPPPAGGGIPAWFMTYSDVITLLMTFFILLLTFATSEPERFSQMQVVTFGGGASGTGVIADGSNGPDHDALVVRYRPSSARVGTDGSETPPIDSDPAVESLAKGLASLDKPNEMVDRQSFRFDMDWATLFDAAGTPSEFATERLRLLAVQMQRIPLEARLQVPVADDVIAAAQLADQLCKLARIPAGRVSIGVRPDGVPSPRTLRIIIARGDQTSSAPTH